MAVLVCKWCMCFYHSFYHGKYGMIWLDICGVNIWNTVSKKDRCFNKMIFIHIIIYDPFGKPPYLLAAIFACFREFFRNLPGTFQDPSGRPFFQLKQNAPPKRVANNRNYTNMNVNPNSTCVTHTNMNGILTRSIQFSQIQNQPNASVIVCKSYRRSIENYTKQINKYWKECKWICKSRVTKTWPVGMWVSCARFASGNLLETLREPPGKFHKRI